MSATAGKDFTMTPSKLIQFDPGTFCVYTLFHVFVRKSGDGGKDRLLCNFSQLETPQGTGSPLSQRDEFVLEALPLIFYVITSEYLFKMRREIITNKIYKILRQTSKNPEKMPFKKIIQRSDTKLKSCNCLIF